MSEIAWPDSPFWEFSLALYARPGVPDACIALQDRHGLDVNMLLFCCWAAARRQRLAPADLARALEASRDWAQDVVRPLRRIRRRLKRGHPGAPPNLVEHVRQRVAAAELDGEHLEQLLLAATLPKIAAAESDGPAALAMNIAAFGKAAWIEWETADAERLAVIVHAAFPDLPAQAAGALGRSIAAGSAGRPHGGS